MPNNKKINKVNKIKNTPLVLIILDGWGVAPPSAGNAITLAKTPVMNSLWKKYPHTTLKASGKYAGLPPQQGGNSEAGHMNIGAGRIVDQDSVLITKSINDGTFFKNSAFLTAIWHAKKHHSNLHLLGILSGDQSPHASPEHLEALLKLARMHKVKNVYLHLFTDGRDSSRYEAIKLLKKLEKKLYPNESIATIMGRYYLDRTKHWDITLRGYNALVLGEGLKVKSPNEAVLQAYNRGETDEFITPSIITHDHKPPRHISDNDSVIFFNLRSDRARQLTKIFVQKDFNAKNAGAPRRKKILKKLKFAAMTDFGPDLEGVLTAYPSIDVPDTLPMALSGIKQLYVAESQKYAHMTYFFNGGYADPVDDEDRICLPSIQIKHFEERPEMAAPEITATVLKKLKEGKYGFIALNFANADMIGHTGDLKAAIKGIEYVDACIGKIAKVVLGRKGSLVISADHGNAEEMLKLKTNEVDTKHSNFDVPFILAAADKKLLKRKNLPKGILGNIAPTILDVLGIKKPKLMASSSLLC